MIFNLREKKNKKGCLIQWICLHVCLFVWFFLFCRCTCWQNNTVHDFSQVVHYHLLWWSVSLHRGTISNFCKVFILDCAHYQGFARHISSIISVRFEWSPLDIKTRTTRTRRSDDSFWIQMWYLHLIIFLLTKRSVTRRKHAITSNKHSFNGFN